MGLRIAGCRFSCTIHRTIVFFKFWIRFAHLSFNLRFAIWSGSHGCAHCNRYRLADRNGSSNITVLCRFANCVVALVSSIVFRALRSRVAL